MSLNVFAVSKLVADLLPSEAVVLLIFPSKKELGKLLVGGRVDSLQSHPLTICIYGILGKMTNNGI
jgi:hypothetical protein